MVVSKRNLRVWVKLTRNAAIIFFAAAKASEASADQITSRTSGWRPEAGAKYVICNAGSGQCIGTAYGGRDPGTGLVQIIPSKALAITFHQTSEGCLRFQAGVDNLYFDVAFASNVERCPIVLNRGSTGSQQLWNVERLPNSKVIIRSRASNQVMAVKDGSSETFAQIVQTEFTGDEFQKWNIRRLNSSTLKGR